MLRKIEQIVYIITDDNEERFYKSMVYYVSDIFNVTRFDNIKTAKYHLDRCLNQFQSKIFTKIISIKITIERG